MWQDVETELRDSQPKRHLLENICFCSCRDQTVEGNTLRLSFGTFNFNITQMLNLKSAAIPGQSNQNTLKYRIFYSAYKLHQSTFSTSPFDLLSHINVFTLFSVAGNNVSNSQLLIIDLYWKCNEMKLNNKKIIYF